MKRAICFGQNAVDQQADEYAGWSGILAGCVPDARDLCVAFANLGFEASARLSGWNVGGPQNPWVLSLDCTREAWRQSHLDAQAVAKAGDLFVFGNSGHGGTYPDALTPGQAGETLCFADGQMDDTEFHRLMVGWPAGVRVVYVLDSCHSGGLDRDRMRHAPRCAPKWVSNLNSPRLRDAIRPADIQAQVLQFCACRAAETASDGPTNGAFTGSLLSVWEQAWSFGRRLTWKQWFDATYGVMQTNGFAEQHPVLNVLGSGASMLDETVIART